MSARERESMIGLCEAIENTITQVRKMLKRRGPRSALAPRDYLTFLLTQLHKA